MISSIVSAEEFEGEVEKEYNYQTGKIWGFPGYKVLFQVSDYQVAEVFKAKNGEARVRFTNPGDVYVKAIFFLTDGTTDERLYLFHVSGGETGETAIDRSNFAERVLELVNEERAKKKLKPLKLAEDLCQWAEVRAKECVEVFAHVRPNGDDGTSIISSEKYKELISQDEKSKDILVPHLRGRNIKQYQISWEGSYLINCHNGLKEEKIDPVDINHYMPIKEHLDVFYDTLIDRTHQGDTPYNLRNCTYLRDFDQKKMIYHIQAKIPSFYLDTEGYYFNDKAFMVVGHHIGYLTAFFNSALFQYCFFEEFPPIQGGNREMRKVILERIPVKDVTDEEDAEYERRVMEIQQMKRDGLQTEEKEHELDLIILAHYGITDPEQQNIFFSKLNE